MRESEARFIVLRLSNKKKPTFASELISNHEQKVPFRCLSSALSVPIAPMRSSGGAFLVLLRCLFGASVASLQKLTIFLNFGAVKEVFFHIGERDFP